MSKNKKLGIYSRRRRGELGNVFFTLFGAVAVVGVLGAGIMSTMRGPLSTMVEVNRREQAKAELRVAASLVLVTADDNSLEVTCAGEATGDGYTEAPQPIAGAGPTGGGVLPMVGAVQNDPWGNAYGYCAWNHGPGAVAEDTAGCGLILAGTTSTNSVAIAIMSAGPDGNFDTTCADDPTYESPTGGGGDDIVVTMTYDQAISGSGGLWNVKATDPNVAEIALDLEVTGGGTFTDVLDLTGASAQLQLGASSLLLPDQTTVPNAQCTTANAGILRFNTTTGSVEVCDGTNFENSGIWDVDGTGRLSYMGGNVGIGVAVPDDALDVAGSAQITGAADLDSTLDVAGAATLSSTLDVTGATSLSSTLGVTGTSTLNNDVTIQGSTSDNTADALTVNDSSSANLFTVQNDGNVGIGVANPNQELDVSGDIQASGTYMIDGENVLATVDGGSSSDSVLVGSNAGGATIGVTGADNTIIGADAAENLTSGERNIVLGAQSGTTLTTENDNIIIGYDVDPPSGDNQLNIGNTITGDISTGDVNIAGDLTVTGGNLDLAGSTDGDILIDTGAAGFSPVTMSGDIQISSGGATTIQDNAVQENDIDASSFAATGPGSSDCLKTDGSVIFTESCSSGGGGDGVGADGLPEILANNNDANSTAIINMADPTNAQDAATKNYVDNALGALSSDRIQDTDNNTYIDVDTTDDGLTDTMSFVRAGTEVMTIDANAVYVARSSSLTVTPMRVVNNSTGGASIGFYQGGNPKGFVGALNDDTLIFLNNTTENMRLSPNGNLVIGGTSPEASAILQTDSTTRGFLAPRMTAAQRDAIGTPATGLLIFTTDVGDAGLFQFYDGANWIDVGGGGAAGGGLWSEDGTNDYIEYDDTLGGVRIGRVTGQPAPETDWQLDTTNDVVYTSANTVAIGSGTVSDNGGTNTDVMLDLSGDINAVQYCDADGANCFDYTSLGSGGIADDSLDWDKFIDAMTLDADTTIDMTAGDLNFDGGTLFIDSSANSIGIGTNVPDDSALLDLTSTSRGFLAPRMDTTARDAISSPATGLMVFTTDAGTAGLYQFYDGSNWVNIGDGGATAIAIAIDDLTDALKETTGNNMLIGSEGSGTIDTTNNLENLAVGINALTSLTDPGATDSTGDSNTAIGYNSMNALSTGHWNTAVGASSGRNLTTGAHNSMLGINALVNLSTGNANVAVGQAAMEGLSTGSDNVAVGALAGVYIRSTSSDNTLIGRQAGRGNTTDYSYDGTNNVIIGADAALNLDGTNNQNTIIGANTAASFNGGGANNILLGYGVDVSSASASNELNIGGTIFGDLTNNQIGLGVADATAINADAILELDSTTRGFLGPRMTTTDRDNISAPSAGLLIYNTSTNTMDFYNGSVWTSFASSAGGSTVLIDADSDTQIQVEEGGAGTDDDTIRFDTAGIERMVIAAGGNVGIGNATPSSALDVTGDIEVSNYVKFNGVAGDAPTYITQSGLDWDAFVDTMTLDATTTIDMDTNAADLNFDSNTLFIDSDVNRVGIGTETPTVALDIAGTIRITDGGETCDGTTIGALKYNTTSTRVEFCDGTAWQPVAIATTQALLVVNPATATNMDISTSGSPAYGAYETFTVSNVGGTTSQTMTAVLGGTNAGSFEIGTDTCTGNTIAAGASCTVDVRPLAFGDGTYSGTLTISANNSPIASLSGTASASCGTIGTVQDGGQLAACTANYRLIVTPTGCDLSDFNEPTCSGTDTDTLAWSEIGVTDIRTRDQSDSYDQNWVGLNTDGLSTLDAFHYCNALTLNGETDWYLPSYAELAAMQPYVTELDLTSNAYHNSTDGNNISTNMYDFGTAGGAYIAKYGNGYIRCVRRVGDEAIGAKLEVDVPGFKWDINTIGSPASGPAQTFTVENVGVSNTGAINTYLTDAGVGFSILSDTCNTTDLAPGATCEIQVQPTSVNDGIFREAVTLDAPNARTAISLQADFEGICNGLSFGDPLDGGIFVGCFNGEEMIISPSACGTDPANPACTGLSDDSMTLAGALEDINIPGADDLNDGQQNTIDIMARVATSGVGTYPAAEYCDAFDFDGYQDWYLPSRDELNFISILSEYGKINQFSGGLYQSLYQRYFSSTENSASSMYAPLVGDYTLDTSTKNNSRRVRCFRRNSATPIGASLTISPSPRTGMDVTGPGSPAYGSNVTFTVTNVGDATSDSLGAALNNGTNFVIITDNCSGNTLAASGGSCSIILRPMATGDGPISDTLQISGNNAPAANVSGTSTGFSVPAGSLWDFNGTDAIHPFTLSHLVGIGTSAPDASAKLQIDSTTSGFLAPRMTATERDNISSPATGLMVYNTDANTLDYYNGSAWVSFASNAGTATKAEDADGDTWVRTEDDSDVDNDTLRFAAGDSVEHMRITSAGNVGIGTTTPANELDVVGDARANSLILNGVAGDAPTYITQSGLDWDDFVDTMTLDATTTIDMDTNTADLNFDANTLFIDSSANMVGIGDATPNVALDVVGDIEYTGTITDVSDRRLKTDIIPLDAEDMIRRLSMIDTYTFRMIDDEQGRIEFGVMAQELEDIFPELVHTAKDEMGTKSVNYTGLIAPMIEATQALKDENDALRAELSDMKAGQENIQATLASLNEQVELLNKAAADDVNKASLVPTTHGWLYLLLGMLGTLCFVLLITRKTAKAD